LASSLAREMIASLRLGQFNHSSRVSSPVVTFHMSLTSFRRP
jgi:hypothetical protein